MITPNFAIPDDALEIWDAFISSALSHAELQIAETQRHIGIIQSSFQRYINNIKRSEVDNIQRTLAFSAYLVSVFGWGLLITLATFLGLGYFGFLGGIAGLIATNPPLAAALLLLGAGASGAGVVLVWKNRQVIRAATEAGETFKPKYERLRELHEEIADRVGPVTELHLECVIAIIEAVLKYQLNRLINEEAMLEMEAELSQTTEPPIANLEQVPMFLSYAREDKRFRERLIKHLAILMREGKLTHWHDEMIVAGKEWKQEILKELSKAKMIISLISNDFFYSGFSNRPEMNQALKRHDSGEARVIPVIVRSCDWRPTPFGKLEPLPREGKPIAEWKFPDAAYTDVAIGIRRVISELNTQM